MLTHIETVAPRIGQRGTTVAVTIQGICLKDPREIVFYRPGIRAVGFETLPNLTPPIFVAHGCKVEEQIRCKFVIAPDCPLGCASISRPHGDRDHVARHVSCLSISSD